MKKDIYLTESPSVFNLMYYLKERDFPMQPPDTFPTMKVFYETVLPKELFSCLHYKTAEQNEKNANTTWLHRGDPTANGRRHEMTDILTAVEKGGRTSRSVRILPDMSKRIAKLLTKAPGIQEEKVLSEILLRNADCIPFSEEDPFYTIYLRHMRYYIQKDVSYSLTLSILSLLLGKYAETFLRHILQNTEEAAKDISLNAAILAYENEAYVPALQKLEEVIKNKDAAPADKVRALYLAGEIYRTGAAGKRDATQAVYCYESAYRLSEKQDADVCYRLFEMAYHGDGHKSKLYAEAAVYLDDACRLKQREALLKRAAFLAAGESHLKIKKDPDKARQLYEEGALKGDAAFLYGLGQLEESVGRIKEAEHAYFRASQAGNREAAYRLTRLRQTHLQVPRSVDKKKTNKSTGNLPKKLIVSNAENQMTHAFTESASSYLAGTGENWTLLDTMQDTEDKLFAIILQMSHPPKQTAEWNFILFHDNDAKNYADAQRIIACLNQCAEQEAWRTWLMESVTIFFKSSASESVSALQSDRLNALYGSAKENGEPAPCYRIRICNADHEAVLFLLSSLPLFMTTLGTKREYSGNIFLWGDGEICGKLIRDILAVYPYKNLYREKTRISVAAQNADAIRMQVAKDAPALFERESRGIRRADLHFYPENDGEILRILDGGVEELQDPLYEALTHSDYFIICGDDDERNAEMALLLREKLMRKALSGKWTPTIAALIRNQFLAESLTDAAAQEDFQHTWHSHYNIIPFGMTETIFSYRNLCKNRLEERAYRMHLSYYGAKSEDVWQAFGDYWSRYFNRDSSVMSALGTIYAAAAAGITLSDIYSYGTEAEKELSDRYGEWLSHPANRDLAAILEHERWRYLLYTRGWKQASLAQAERYIKAGNPYHQLYIAKLHPYLCEWDELDRLGERFNQMMHTLIPGYRERDIKAADYTMVDMGVKLLMD